MAPRSILAQLVVALRDDASGPAKALAGTLKGLERSAVDFAKTMNGAKWGSNFTKQLGGLKATQDELAKIKQSWADLQGQLSGAKGRLRTDAQRQWANEWLARLQAVRIADQQNTEEAIRNAKRRSVEEARAAAETAREKARIAREEARQKDQVARQAARAAVQAERETTRIAKAAARERSSEERRAAMESAKLARDAARERDRIARDEARVARAAAREQVVIARNSAREAARAERDAARAERRGDRSAAGIGRAVVRNLGYAAGAGTGTYLAGRGIRAGSRAGGEAMREDARDYLAGLSEADSRRIGNISTEQSANYKSLTSTSLHALYRETATTALGMEGMAAVAPDLAQGMTVLQSLKGRDEALSQLTGFMRALDTLGKNVNPADVRSLLDGMARAAGVQGVEYQPKQVFTMAKQARSAGGALSNEFLNTIAPSLIADMGPAAPGTAMATLMSSVVGGTLSGGNTKQKLARQRELGLRRADNTLPAADRDMMTQNPHLYAWNRLIPTLEGRGIDIKNESAVSEELNRLFTRTVSDLFGKLISQRDQYQNTQKRLAAAPGLGGADSLDEKDPFVALAGVTSQMVNTAAEISKPIIGTIMPALGGLAGSLNKLSTAIRNNPEFAKEFGEAGGGAGIGGALGGGAMALKALWQSKGIAGAISGGMRGGLLGSIAGLVVGALGPDVWRFVTGETGRATPGQKSANQIDQGTYERARRAQDEYRRDPEAARGRAMMRGSSSPADMTSGVPATAPAPTVDAAAAAANGAAAGTALGTGVATGIAAQAPAVEAQGRSIMDRLRSLFSSGVTVPVTVQQGGGGATPASSTPAVPARGSGGSVAAGGLYRVNEYGEEFYQPTEDGRIIDPRRIKAGGGGAKTASINLGGVSFSITGASDPEAVANQVVSIINDKVQEAARAAFADLGVELA